MIPFIESKTLSLLFRTLFNSLSINLGSDSSLLISGLVTPDIPPNPPNCIILDKWVFENFILADETFAKALRIFETCVFVNNDLCGKLVSSLALATKFDERFKVTSVPFLLQILTY